MNCLSCHAETSNGLALCEQCQMAASVYLEFLPVHFRNLARWKPGQAGSRPVPQSTIPKGVLPPGRDPVVGALDEAGNALSTWARSLHDDRGVDLPTNDDEVPMVFALCGLFSTHLTSIATLEWAGEFVQEMADHEGKLRRLAEQYTPGWYAGACRRCEVSTFVVPGLTWVTCGGCGATTYARDHLEVILTEARDWVARPKALAEAVVALVDTEQSVPRLNDRIRKWQSLGWLEGERRLDRDGHPSGPRRYRLGDVLDLVATPGMREEAKRMTAM